MIDIEEENRDMEAIRELEMTDYQYESIIKIILMILENCKDIEEAKKKIETLLKKETHATIAQG
jgi:uncharacterized protein Smg (DUF494 family)